MKTSPAPLPVELPVANIRPNRRQPRRNGFKPSELSGLMRSIDEEGLKEPITVRLVESTPLAGNFYELIDGGRRHEAHRLMRRETITAYVKQVDEVEGAVECIVRFLHNAGPTPMEEALGFKELVSPPEAGGLGLSKAEAARRTGMTEAHVNERLLLCEAPAAAQKALLEGRLDVGHVLPIARLPEEAVRETALARVLAGNVDGRPYSVEAVQTLIRTEFMRDLRTASFRREDATLVPAAGPCTTCLHRTGANPARFGVCVGGAAQVCTRPDCYRAKVAASRLAATADLEAEGVQVLPPEVCEQEFPGGHKGLRYNSAYVVLTQAVPAELLKAEVAANGAVTWQDLLEDAPAQPPRCAGFDQEGRVVHLVDRKLAEAAVDAGERHVFRSSDRKAVRITKAAVAADAAPTDDTPAPGGGVAAKVAVPPYDFAAADKLLNEVDDLLTRTGWRLAPGVRSHPENFIQPMAAPKRGKRAA